MRKAGSTRWYWNRLRAYIGRPRMIVQTKPVLIDDHAYCENPVFIVGPHRSGTSLVRRLFNSHPDIACPPESFFIPDYAAMLADEHVLSGYAGFGYSAEDARRDLARKASSLHEAYRLATGKRIWADKTPRYSLQMGAIDRLYGGKARFVLVLRHPGDVVYSIFKRDWRFTDHADGFESALDHVRNCIAAMLDFEAHHPARSVRIDYVMLCETPEAELGEALGKLGLAFDPAMLDFAEQDHNFGLEDPVVRGTRVIQPQSGSWRALGAAQQARLVEAFGPEIERAGYWAEGGKPG